jgi:hypothetical protein
MYPRASFGIGNPYGTTCTCTGPNCTSVSTGILTSLLLRATVAAAAAQEEAAAAEESHWRTRPRCGCSHSRPHTG